MDKLAVGEKSAVLLCVFVFLLAALVTCALSLNSSVHIQECCMLFLMC